MHTLKRKFLTPIVETLLPETDIEDICNVIDRIGKEYHKKAKGLAKHKVYNEFVKVEKHILPNTLKYSLV